VESLIGPTPLRILNQCSLALKCKVYGKLEIYNPTGSHKDRESEEIIAYAKSRGIGGLAIASTGNAAISLAAYSLIRKLRCNVYLPEGIAPERLAQIQAYHPNIIFAGDYEEAIAECNRQAPQEGLLNCNPGARIEKIKGDSRIGVEIASRIKPDYVICPTNNGTLLAGVWMGLKRARVRTQIAAAVTRETTLAEAIAGFHRIEEPALSKTLQESRSKIVEVSDPEIAEAARLLISDGLIVEGASAAAIACLRHLEVSQKTRVVCVITGSGLKFPTSIKELLST
jgi:threonine synthase